MKTGGNANKTTRIDKRFSISITLALLIFMISGSTMSYAAPQTLPSCTDPTGQNLPCMMVISTLPPPPNALQCQETSGQILPCSYMTQSLSNGEQIVAITVYVPASYVFTGYGPWTLVKQIVHETTTKTKIVTRCPDSQILNHTTHKCENIPLPCERPDANAKTDPDTNLKTKDCDLGDANEHIKLPCERPDINAKTDPDTDLKTMDCDLGDANEHIKTPLPPSCNSANNNGTCLTNNNTKTAASVGKGGGPSCVYNCTTGTPMPPVICKTNPNDPSCPPIVQPLTPPTSPSTQTCPDGSVIDASASCPTQSTPPPTNPPPSPDNNNPPPTDNNPTPPSDNNPNPPSSDNGNPSSSNNDKGGDKSSGGSDKGSSQPGSVG